MILYSVMQLLWVFPSYSSRDNYDSLNQNLSTVQNIVSKQLSRYILLMWIHHLKLCLADWQNPKKYHGTTNIDIYHRNSLSVKQVSIRMSISATVFFIGFRENRTRFPQFLTNLLQLSSLLGKNLTGSRIAKTLFLTSLHSICHFNYLYAYKVSIIIIIDTISAYR